jgi:predicted TIM-barrel fold metal-dependent hydrolase
MDRCVSELGFVGFYVNPDPTEGNLETPHMGEDYWYPIYEKLVQLNVPGIIHTGSGRFAAVPEAEYLLQEEAVATWGILRSPNVFQDFPSLKLIVAHGGAGIPYQYGRAKGFRLNERARGGDESWEPIEESFRRLYYDTALLDQGSVDLLLQVCGVGRCLFGSDSPGIGSVINPATGRPLNDVKSMIDSVGWLTADDRMALFDGNVRKVFTRMPVAVSGTIAS